MKSLPASIATMVLAVGASNRLAAGDDFSWIRGANYVPSYAATDVVLWLNYDHDTIDRELGYAESIGLNAVRIFLQSLVYQHDPDKFLRRFEDFVATADAHGLKVMPVLFDSCFGVSPSLESQHLWVANPGPDHMGIEFWQELDEYAKAVVPRYVNDDRIVMWDVMNEPSATPLTATQGGREQLLAFVRHYCNFVKQLDPTHPITVGVARADNSFVEKPDHRGKPYRRAYPERLVEYLEFVTRDPVSDSTWRERSTLITVLATFHGTYGEETKDVLQRFEEACAAHTRGRKPKAFQIVGELLTTARRKFEEPQKQAIPAPLPEKAYVYRDVYGVPHIFADTEPAAAYALARAQCQDNARQVFYNLRLAMGRTAEVHGEKGLDKDQTVLLWRLPETMEKAWRQTPPRNKRFVQAFCDGLNDYRRDHPEECKHTMPADAGAVLAWMKYVGHMPSVGIIRNEVNATLGAAKQPSETPDQSSCFTMGPTRTALGRPILMIDPHWPAQGMFSFYEFHLHAGRLQVGGFAVPGLPFAALGYTNGVAWAGTAGGADSADAFELNINPDNENQYWYDGCWREMLVREVMLPVKQEDGEVEQRRLVLRETLHGPVVREEKGRVFAGAVCGWKDTDLVEQWLAMNRAGTRDELLRAVGKDQATWLNFAYATREGHMGYIQTGCCPLRNDRYISGGAQDGTSSESNWQGRIPFDKLPQLHDPASGWLQNCNTAANVVTAGMTMSTDDFPPGVLFGHVPIGGHIWRGRMLRCYEVLPTFEKATLDDAEGLALDTYCPGAAIWTGPLVEAYDTRFGTFADPALDLKIAVDSLRNWGYRVVKGSVAATIFRFWRSEYRKLRPESLGNRQATAYPKTKAEQADAIKALQEACQYLKEHHGSVLVPWGDVMRLHRGDLDLPLDGDALPDSETMRSTGNGNLTDDGHCVFNGGQVVTTVVELTDPIRVRSIVPYGQSSKPESRHYADQMRLYSDGMMRPAWHTWPQLREHVESVEVVEYLSSTTTTQ